MGENYFSDDFDLSDSKFDVESGVYVVELPNNPPLWTAYCDECVAYLIDATQDREDAVEAENAHKQLHSEI